MPGQARGQALGRIEAGRSRGSLRAMSSLRRSLRTSMIEGAFAELVGACAAGGTLTAWALYLELSPVLIGILGALPFAVQVIHLPSAWITRRFGSRRTALWLVGISRQAV